MPLKLGLDYGTTTSLLYEYGENNRLDERARELSSVRVQNGRITCGGAIAMENNQNGLLIKSPKRDFINSRDVPINGVTYSQMIEYTIQNMFNGSDRENLPGSHVTITVPNGYTGKDCIDMLNIVRQAIGVDDINIHFIPEPVAAALYYVYSHPDDEFSTRHFIVCDIGGGTTDMSIVTCTKVDQRLGFTVEEGQQNNLNLGGDVFDDRLLHRLEGRPDNRDDQVNVQWLKHILSSAQYGTAQIKGRNVSCTRKSFEDAINKELNELCRMMEALNRNRDNIEGRGDWVVLRVGGSCRIPAIQGLLNRVFPVKKIFEAEPGDIFYSVAQGAAIYSAVQVGCVNMNIDIAGRAPHEISFRTRRGEWEQIVAQNAPDGEHRVVVRLEGGEKADRDGFFSVGAVKLKEGGREMQWPINLQRQDFRLENRRIEDVLLTLCIETRNGRPVRCSITDTATNESDTWEINNN